MKTYWTASNNNTFLSIKREANSMLGAVRAARRYVRDELGNEGTITYYHDPDDVPFRIDIIPVIVGYRG